MCYDFYMNIETIQKQIQDSANGDYSRKERWSDSDAIYYKDLSNTRNETRAGGPNNSANRSFSSAIDLVYSLAHRYVDVYIANFSTPMEVLYNSSDIDPRSTRLLAAITALFNKSFKDEKWSILDMGMKRHLILYGRGILMYSPLSNGRYSPHLSSIHPVNFLIDPSTDPTDMQTAKYMGYKFSMSKSELQAMADSGAVGVQKDVINEFLKSQEERNVSEGNHSYSASQISGDQPNLRPTPAFSYDLHCWFSYDADGTKKMSIVSTDHSKIFRTVPLKKINSKDMYPFASISAMYNPHSFWSDSLMDRVIALLWGQDEALNQMQTNAEKRNNPMMLVDVEKLSVKNPLEMRYKKNRIVSVKSVPDIRQVAHSIETPTLTTPLQVLHAMQNLLAGGLGATDIDGGVSEDRRVGIYLGNADEQQQIHDIVMDSVYTAWQDIAKLYLCGIYDYMGSSTAVDMIGFDGIPVKFSMSRGKVSDYGMDKINVVVRDKGEDQNLAKKQTKVTFFQAHAGNPHVNAKVATEVEMRLAGFSDEEVKRLLDTEEYLEDRLISSAKKVLSSILSGEYKPDIVTDANEAFLQYFFDFLDENREKITKRQYLAIIAYIGNVQPYVHKNIVSQSLDFAAANDQLHLIRALGQPQAEGLSTPLGY